jgi:uncharacterized membrane protein
MEPGEQIRSRIAIILASVGHFLWRAWNCYRFFTPHYWRTRAHRDDIAHTMQALLPPPYDPYAIELRCRSINHAAIPADVSQQDDPWSPVIEKLSAKALDRRLATVGAVEIAAWSAEDVHSAFASIDHDVIAGVALRAGGTINSFSDLSERLAPHTIAERLKLGLHAANVDTFAPAVRPLVGSVGEETVLRHLHEAGVDSHLAPHLNTPGWDLTWNGNDHLVNVKTWQDVSDLSSHFDHYSQIPAVVPIDASGIPEHSLHFDPATGHGLDGVHDALASGSHNVVIVDDALSGSALHDHLQHAENLVTHGDTVVHGHLPFITMALSGIREFDLLVSGKTDFASAAKNAALDAMGTGVGGAVGAHAGAGIGTIICPGVGTVIGGIAGAIFGAIKGRKLTGDIKQRPFKEAVSAYESSFSRFQSEGKIYEEQAAAELTEVRVAQEALLKRSALQARQVVEETKHALESWVVYDSWMHPDEACALITQSLDEIARLRAAILGDYGRTALWRKFLWPDVTTLAYQEALGFFRRISRKLGDLRSRARKGQPMNRGQVMALLGTVGVMQEQMAACLEKIYTTQRERDEQAHTLLTQTLSGLLRERQEVERRLSQKLEAIRVSIREAMLPALTAFHKCAESARIEGAKLGISL